jgi:malonyl-CoA O-methyltransferase
MNRAAGASLDLHAVRHAFDRAAAQYDRHAVLQHEVEQRLLERLEFVRGEPARILDLGCGTGIASEAMRGRFGGATVIGLDWSRGMLARFSERNRNAALPLCADMQSLPLPPRSLDLVFSNLAVQWSSTPEALFAGIRKVLRPGGMLLFSTFGPDTLHELRSAWRTADQEPHVNRFTDMHDIGDLLLAAGFSDPVMDVDLLTLEYPDVISLMRELKAIGAHNALAGRSTGLTGKEKFRRVIESYERFRSGDIYPATYEVIYGLAYGPPDGRPVRTAEGEEASFPVDALRTAGKGNAE